MPHPWIVGMFASIRATARHRQLHLVSCFLGIAFFLLCSHAFGQVFPGCPSGHLAARSQQELLSTYRKSVFKVYAIRSGTPPSYRGTATLIDSRGYFLTASHIFEGLPELTGEGPWVNPYGGTLKLVNRELGFEVEAKELFHRRNQKAPDVSVLRADLPEVIRQTLSPVEPLLDPPTPSSKEEQLLMIGYPAQDEGGLAYLVQPMGELFSDTLLLVAGAAFPGQSGSLAINVRGNAIGVLHRRDDPDTSRLFFTFAAAAEEQLVRVEPSMRIIRLLESLERGSFDRDSDILVKTFSFSNVDLTYLLSVLTRQPLKYHKGLKTYDSRLFYLFLCNGLGSYALRFASLTAPLLPANALLDGARSALGIYESMNQTGLSREVRSKSLVAALNLFVEYEARGELRNPQVSGAYKSEVYSQYAAALSYAKVLGLKQSGLEAAIYEKLYFAIKNDPNNWIPYFLAARELSEKGQFELAAKASASAAKNAAAGYSTQPANKEVLVKMWRDNLQMAILARPDQAAVLTPQLEKGIDTAATLTPRGLLATSGLKEGTMAMLWKQPSYDATWALR